MKFEDKIQPIRAKNKSIIRLLLFFVYSTAFSQSPFSQEIDSLILRGMDYSFLSQFDSALVQCRKLESMLPNESVGYFYHAAVLQSMMMDYETDQWEAEFLSMIEKTIRIGEEKTNSQNCNAWDLFYLGSAHSYKGLYQAKAGKLVAGFISAHSGVGYLEKAYAADSTVFDALLGIGSYKYWAGRFYRYLRWLPWIRDERKTGVQMVEMAIAKGTFSSFVGLNSLGWIQYDRKLYDSAVQLFRKGLERYPSSRFFQWGVGDCLFKMNRMNDAAVVYEGLLDSIRRSAVNNGYNEAECLIKLAECHYASGDFKRSLQYCESVLGLKTDILIAQRIEKKRQAAEIRKKQCLRAIEKGNR